VPVLPSGGYLAKSPGRADLTFPILLSKDSGLEEENIIVARNRTREFKEWPGE